MRTSLTLLTFLLLLSACGEPRRFGDAGGISVTITAHIERAFVSGMENRQARPSVGAGAGFGSGGFSGVGVGVGLSFSSTQVYLAGGDNVGQANIFRKEVKWGDNTFTVPLTASRTLHLSVQVEGGRRGWEALPPVIIPTSDPTIALVLDSNGAKLTVTPVVPAPAPVPAPSPKTESAPAKPAEPPATEPVKPAP
jgi:hypothetical protein